MRNTSCVSRETHVRRFAAPTHKRKINMYESSIIKGQVDGERNDRGFTLVEILIAIVLVGILSAVAVVGISNLVSKGTASACGASKDSATAASAVYFGSTGAYPTTIAQLVAVGANGPALTLPSGVTVNAAIVPAPTAPATTPPAAAIGMQASGGSWWLNMTAAGTATTPPTFVCA
jgi:prepilin-type N-terminal cleavage/methylation domain-containing protein